MKKLLKESFVHDGLLMVDPISTANGISLKSLKNLLIKFFQAIIPCSVEILTASLGGGLRLTMIEPLKYFNFFSNLALWLFKSWYVKYKCLVLDLRISNIIKD